VNVIVNEIITDAKYFGFRNTTDGWEQGEQSSEYIFWDMIHFTSKVHQLIARAALEALCKSTTLRLVTSCPL
jgi:phospholipase/lecithinase/hemolysin